MSSDEDITIGIDVEGADEAADAISNVTKAVTGLNDVNLDNLDNAAGSLDAVTNSAQQVVDPLDQSKGKLYDLSTLDTSNLDGTSQSLDAIGNSASNAIDPIGTSSEKMRQLGSDSETANSNLKSLSTNLTTAVGSIAAVGGSVIGLAENYTSMERAQTNADRANTRLAASHENVRRLQETLNDLIAKGDTGSKKYHDTVQALAVAKQREADQTDYAALAQTHANESFASFVTQLAPQVLGIFGGITTAITTVPNAVNTAKEAFSALRGGMSSTILSAGLLGGGIAALGFAIFAVATNFMGFRDRLNEMGKAIGDAVPLLKPLLVGIKAIGDQLGLTGHDAKVGAKDWNDAMNSMGPPATHMGEQAVGAFDKASRAGDNLMNDVKKKQYEGFWNDLGTAIVGRLQWFGSNALISFENMGAGITKFFVSLPSVIRPYLEEFGKFLLGFFEALKDQIVPAVEGLGNVVVTGFQLAFKDLGAWFQTNVADKISGAWNSLLDTLKKDIYEPIKDHFSGIGTWFQSNVIDPVVRGWNSLLGALKTQVYDPIKDHFSGIGTWFESNVTGPVVRAWNGLLGTLKTQVYDPMKDHFSGIGTWFESNVTSPVAKSWNSLLGTLKTQISDPIKAAFSGTASWFETYVAQPIKNSWQSVVNFFKNNPITQFFQNPNIYKPQAYQSPYGGGGTPYYYAQHGFVGIVDKPTAFVVGEAGPEYVSIVPGGSTVGTAMTTGLQDTAISLASLQKSADLTSHALAGSGLSEAANTTSGSLDEINTRILELNDAMKVNAGNFDELDASLRADLPALEANLSSLDKLTVEQNLAAIEQEHQKEAMKDTTGALEKLFPAVEPVAPAANNATNSLNNLGNAANGAAGSIQNLPQQFAYLLQYMQPGYVPPQFAALAQYGSFPGPSGTGQMPAGAGGPGAYGPFGAYAQYGQFGGGQPAAGGGAAYYGGPPAGYATRPYGAFGAYAQYGQFGGGGSAGGAPMGTSPGAGGTGGGSAMWYGGPPQGVWSPSPYGTFGGYQQYGQFGGGQPQAAPGAMYYGGPPTGAYGVSPYGAFGAYGQYGQLQGSQPQGGPQGNQGGAYTGPQSSPAQYGQTTQSSQQQQQQQATPQNYYGRAFATGFEGIISQATAFIAGEAGPEYVSIKPFASTRLGTDMNTMIEMILELIRQLKNQSINVNVNSYLDGYTVYKNQQKFQNQRYGTYLG